MQLKSSLTVFITFVALIALVPASVSAQKLHPKIKNKPHTFRRVVVMPAQIQLVRSGIKGTEPMEKEAAELRPVLEAVVARVFEKKSFTAVSGAFKPEALQNDEKLKYAVADLQRNFDDLEAKVIRKKKDIEKGRFTLGDQVLLVNQDDTTDAFIFIRAFGQQTTGGKKAFAILTLNPFFFPVCLVSVTVVDARSGDVLARAETVTLGNVVKDTDKALTKGLERSLKKLSPPSDKGAP